MNHQDANSAQSYPYSFQPGGQPYPYTQPGYEQPYPYAQAYGGQPPYAQPYGQPYPYSQPIYEPVPVVGVTVQQVPHQAQSDVFSPRTLESSFEKRNMAQSHPEIRKASSPSLDVSKGSSKSSSPSVSPSCSPASSPISSPTLSRKLYLPGSFPVFGDRFVLDEKVTLVLKEKIISLSGDSAYIKDTDGKTHFQIKGKLLTLHNRSTLMDAKGKLVGDLEKKFFSLHSKVYLRDANKDVRVVIMRSQVLQLRANIKIYIFPPGSKTTPKDYEKQEPEIKVSGDFLAHNFVMQDKNGNKIAKVGRHLLAARNLLFGQDEYLIKCKKGVDIAFITYVTAAIDEIYNDSSDKDGILF